MRVRLQKTGILFLTLLFVFPFVLGAAQLKGKIQSISKKAKSIQMLVIKTNKVEVVRFDKKTKFVNAKSIKNFIKKDLIIAEVEGANKPAKSITRVLIKLPKGKIISTKKLSKMVLKGGKKFTLADARPTGSFNTGHIPGAISIPTTEFSKKTNLLPKNKKSLLIFYCGGPT